MSLELILCCVNNLKLFCVECGAVIWGYLCVHSRTLDDIDHDNLGVIISKINMKNDTLVWRHMILVGSRITDTMSLL